MMRRWSEPVPTWVFLGTRSGKDLATVTLEEIRHESAQGLEERTQTLETAIAAVRSIFKAHPEFLSSEIEDVEVGMLPGKLITAKYFGASGCSERM